MHRHEVKPLVRPGASEPDLRAAHALFRRRIGDCLVEDWDSFRLSATEETADWAPLLLLAEVEGQLAAAQLGGLLPAVRLLSLPYTAVEERFEGQGIYLHLKRAMIERLRAMAAGRGLPAPLGNVAEEAPGSPQYRRKVEGGIAVVLPVAYVQPAAQGLAEAPLALTFEPLVQPSPTFTADDLRRIVVAIYRGLYRIPDPPAHPAFQRMQLGG